MQSRAETPFEVTEPEADAIAYCREMDREGGKSREEFLFGGMRGSILPIMMQIQYHTVVYHRYRYAWAALESADKYLPICTSPSANGRIGRTLFEIVGVLAFTLPLSLVCLFAPSTKSVLCSLVSSERAERPRGRPNVHLFHRFLPADRSQLAIYSRHLPPLLRTV